MKIIKTYLHSIISLKKYIPVTEYIALINYTSKSVIPVYPNLKIFLTMYPLVGISRSKIVQYLQKKIILIHTDQQQLVNVILKHKKTR